VIDAVAVTPGSKVKVVPDDTVRLLLSVHTTVPAVVIGVTDMIDVGVVMLACEEVSHCPTAGTPL
jgi:hypothetical protein